MSDRSDLDLDLDLRTTTATRTSSVEISVKYWAARPGPCTLRTMKPSFAGMRARCLSASETCERERMWEEKERRRTW